MKTIALHTNGINFSALEAGKEMFGTARRAQISTRLLSKYAANIERRRNLSEIIEKMNRPISVPTFAICGVEDIRGEVLAAQNSFLRAFMNTKSFPIAGIFCTAKNRFR